MAERELDAVREEDRLLDALGAGAEGSDELTRMLADLRDEVRSDAPPAPVFLAGSGADDADDATRASDAACASGAAASAGAGRASGTPTGGRHAAVTDLSERRRGRPWLAGLVGAAAATMLIACSGLALNATGVLDRGQDQQALVELAGTLDQMEAASNSGDEETARRLLLEARELIAGMEGRTAETATERLERTISEKVTETPETSKPEKPSAKSSEPTRPEASTETVTETSTVVITTTVPGGSPQPPSQPTSEPTPTTTIQLLPETDSPSPSGQQGDANQGSS